MASSKFSTAKSSVPFQAGFPTFLPDPAAADNWRDNLNQLRKRIMDSTVMTLSRLWLPALLSLGTAWASDKPVLEVNLLYIEQRIERPPVLSNLVSWPEDEGLRGAELAVADNNTTGKFMGQVYRMEPLIFDENSPHDVTLAGIQSALSGKPVIAVLNLPDDLLLSVADLDEAQDDLLFNAQSAQTALRDENCRSNLLHTISSRAMLSDALVQFFVLRRWDDVFLLSGNRSGDLAMADALRASAKKFGVELVEEKQWLEDADMRRNASAEVPLLTQADAYDVLVVADEDRDFAQYILYNTWLPRPVAGSAGLQPVVWSRVIEQWGAAQLQSRFTDLADRDMGSRDYANWAAVRAIGEAVTRTNAVEVVSIRQYLLSDEFELAGFKGLPLSFRPWNGQLRQPVQLVHADAVVATAPVEGFLHQLTELDTLGIDKPESRCQKFRP